MFDEKDPTEDVLTEVTRLESDSLGDASLDSCHTGWGPLQTVDETAFANVRKAWKSNVSKIVFTPINLSIVEMCFTKKGLSNS